MNQGSTLVAEAAEEFDENRNLCFIPIGMSKGIVAS